MFFVPSVSRAQRAELRRLRAEFDAALDALGDEADRSSPAYRAADARYRAWVQAVDAVAVALLDDLDACEAAAAAAPAAPPRPSAGPAMPADVERLFAGLDDLRGAADLIGAAPPPAARPRSNTPRSRAMGVIGADRAARHWGIGLGADRPGNPAGRAP